MERILKKEVAYNLEFKASILKLTVFALNILIFIPSNKNKQKNEKSMPLGNIIFILFFRFGFRTDALSSSANLKTLR